jgi:hypothetical protein
MVTGLSALFLLELQFISFSVTGRLKKPTSTSAHLLSPRFRNVDIQFLN